MDVYYHASGLEQGFNPGTAVALPHREHPAAALEPTDTEVIAPLFAVALAGAAAAGYYGLAWRQKRIDAKRERDAAAAQANEIVERTISHDAAGLVLSNMFANVVIAADAEEIGVRLRGKKSHIDALKTKQNAKALTVYRDKDVQYLVSASLRISRSGKSLADKIHRMVLKRAGIQLVDESDKIEVSVGMPEGTDLTLLKLLGKTTASGKIGDLKVDKGYRQAVTIEEAENIDVAPGQSGSVKVGKMNGKATVHTSYNSHVRIRDGLVTALRAELGQLSELIVDTNAHNPALSTAYNSRADLASATGNLQAHAGQSSTVTVRGGQVESVRINTAYNSRVTYNGDAKRAHINAGQGSDATVGSASEHLKVRTAYNSRVRVANGDIRNADLDCGQSSEVKAGGKIMSGTIRTTYNAYVQALAYGKNVRIQKGQSSRIVTRSR